MKKAVIALLIVGIVCGAIVDVNYIKNAFLSDISDRSEVVCLKGISVFDIYSTEPPIWRAVK